MNTGPGCECHPLDEPTGNTIFWTARSNPGRDLMLMSQSSVLRLISILSSLPEGMKVVRLRRLFLVGNDPAATIDASISAFLEMGLTAALPSLQPSTPAANSRRGKQLLREFDIDTSEGSG